MREGTLLTFPLTVEAVSRSMTKNNGGGTALMLLAVVLGACATGTLFYLSSTTHLLCQGMTPWYGLLPQNWFRLRLYSSSPYVFFGLLLFPGYALDFSIFGLCVFECICALPSRHFCSTGLAQHRVSSPACRRRVERVAFPETPATVVGQPVYTFVN